MKDTNKSLTGEGLIDYSLLKKLTGMLSTHHSVNWYRRDLLGSCSMIMCQEILLSPEHHLYGMDWMHTSMCLYFTIQCVCVCVRVHVCVW